jgi:hypothetical protein
MGSDGGAKGGLVKYAVDKLMRDLIDLVCKLAHSKDQNDQITIRSLIYYKIKRLKEIQDGKPNP